MTLQMRDEDMMNRGREEGREEVALGMLDMFEDEVISKVTNLSLQRVKELRTNQKFTNRSY